LKLSARNMLKGKVKAVKPNQTNTEVIIELPGGIGCDIHHRQGVSPELETDQWQRKRMLLSRHPT